MLPKLEEMILLALVKHGPDATASDIQAAITEVAGREQAFGSIFTTLDRLADKKHVKWVKGQPDPRRGGRAPRLYTLTASGRATLIASIQATQAMAEGLNIADAPVAIRYGL